MLGWGPNGGQGSEQAFFMAPYLVHHEPLSVKSLCQPLLMAEMPLLFHSPLDGIPPHNPMGDVPLKTFLLLTMIARSRHHVYSGSLKNWHHIAFQMGKAMVNRNSMWQIIYSNCIHKARSATGNFGILAQSAWDCPGRVTRPTYRLAGIAYPNLV